MRPPQFPPSGPRKRPREIDAELANLTRPKPPQPPAPATSSEPVNRVSTRLRERLEELRGARRRARLRTVAIIAAAVVALGAGVWLVGFSSVFALDPGEVEISGTNDFITRKDVQQRIAPYEQTPLARVDVGGLQTELHDHYAVKDADVARVWPHGLKVTLDARTPVAISPKGKGYAILDGDGIELGTVAEIVEGLPMIEVDHESEDLPETLAAVLDVMDALPADLLEQVAAVGAKNPDEVEFTLDSGARVLWGSALEMDLKLAVLEVLLEVPADVYNVVSPLNPITS